MPFLSPSQEPQGEISGKGNQGVKVLWFIYSCAISKLFDIHKGYLTVNYTIIVGDL